MHFKISSNLRQGEFAVDTVVLIPDTWDDYSYRTRFLMYAAPAGAEGRWIGNVKILARTYPNMEDYKYTKDLMEKKFERLSPARFCSLGQELSYYRRLGELPQGLGRKILDCLNDVCFSTAEDWWNRDEGFETSLLRHNSAHLARLDAKTTFEGREVERDVHHHIRFRRSLSTDGGPELFEATFDGSLKVPGRLNVIVGRNGSGKTSLLAGLADWFSQPWRPNQFSYRPEFTRVVVVTFNPFDTIYKQGRDAESNVRFVGRRPITNRLLGRLITLSDNAAVSQGADWHDQLFKAFRTPEDFRAIIEAFLIDETMTATLEQLRNEPEWHLLIREALEEPELADLIQDDPSSAASFMSAGQRSLVNLYAALYLNLDRQALVLLDEPENHLHPSLIARFIRAFNEMLHARRAYAIVATHSPVVVQETPSRFISILERVGNTTTVTGPDFETFGESIDTITERLFDTDFRSSHWKGVLRRMAREGLTAEEAATEISGQPLSLMARTYFAYQLRKRDV